ncbi:MAG: hypothetical protein Q9218_006305, partial [Villophora microphyllina]
MAPRRGGGGGGGSGGSSGIGDTVWGEIVLLPGSHFRDPYATAQIVFQGIGLVGIVAIMIWATTFKKPHEPFRKIFRWYAFWLSALMLFADLAIHFSVDIIYEAESAVQQVFFLIITIIYSSAYISEIALFGVIYLLLPHCSGHPSRETKPRLWKGVQTGHAIFLTILSVLWAAGFALKIKYQVDFVTNGSFEYSTVISPFQKLDTAYAILYFFCTLEIVVWSILGFIDKGKRTPPPPKKMNINNRGQVLTMLPTKSLTILLSTISLPLFIRSVYMTFDVIYEELQNHSGSHALWLATDIIYVLTSLLIYAGIVAICRLLAKSPPYQDPNHGNPAYDPNFWGRNNNGTPHDPKNNNPPPVYERGAYQPVAQGMVVQQPGGQYSPHQGQQMGYYQPVQHQQYPNQGQYQQPYEHQQPYQNAGFPQYQQQAPTQQVHSPPPQNRPVPPSEVGGSSA